MRYGRLVGVLLLGMCGVTLAQCWGQLDVRGNVKRDVKKNRGNNFVGSELELSELTAFCAEVLAGAQAAQTAKIRETVYRQMHGETKEERLRKKVFPPHNKQKRLEVAVLRQQCVHKLYNNKMDGRKNYARRGNNVQQPPRKGAKHSYCA